MSGGNGADMNAVVSMLQNVLSGQHEMRAEMRAEIRALREEHGRKLDDQGRKTDDLAGQVSNLRQAVTEYHASVLGHGILISHLDERVRRIEKHLNLPPAA